MSWKALITDKGNALLSKTMYGGGIALTRAKAGTGTVSESVLHSQTDILSAKQTLSIEKTNKKDNIANVEILLTCRGLETSYNLNQIGIYATDPDDGEILFAIAQLDEGKTIPAESEVPFYSIDFNFSFGLENDQSMVATIDQSTFATKTYVDNMKEDLSEIISSDRINERVTTAISNYLEENPYLGSCDISKFEYGSSINSVDRYSNVYILYDGVELLSFKNYYKTATSAKDGLMDSRDKARLDKLTDNYIKSLVDIDDIENDITELRETLESFDGGTVTDEQLAEAISDYLVDHPIIGTGSSVTSVSIPTLYLWGDESELTTEKNKVNFRYVIVHDGKQKAGYTKLAWQGNATMGYPKKNYTLNLYKDNEYENKDKTDYLDLSGEKHPKWVLKANYNDASMVRNIVSARLWGDVVHTRPSMGSYLSEAPNHGAVDGHPVEVYMNGEYRGLYMYNIPKEDWMLGLDEDDPSHCCVSASLGTAETRWESAGDSYWELEVPKTWQTITNTDGTTISVRNNFKAFKAFVVNATDSEFANGISDYLDVDSAIDYLIFSQVVGNQDSMNKNQMLCTRDAGATWWYTAYDMDQTFGASFTSEAPYTTDIFTGHSNHLFERLINAFPSEIKERYAVLRSMVLSESYICRELELAFAEFPDGVKERNLTKWSATMFRSISDLNSMKTYVRNRLVWCDTYFDIEEPEDAYIVSISCNYDGGSVESGTSLDSLKDNLVVTANYNDGTTLTVSNYTLSGSVGTGSNTITVTYGDLTTSFTVVGTAVVTYGIHVPASYGGTMALPKLFKGGTSGTIDTTKDSHIKIELDIDVPSYTYTDAYGNFTMFTIDNSVASRCGIEQRAWWAAGTTNSISANMTALELLGAGKKHLELVYTRTAGNMFNNGVCRLFYNSSCTRECTIYGIKIYCYAEGTTPMLAFDGKVTSSVGVIHDSVSNADYTFDTLDGLTLVTA